MKIITNGYVAKSGRNRGKIIIWAVTAIDEKNNIARGVSVCSADDEPDDNKGVFLATNRVRRVFKKRVAKEAFNCNQAIKEILRTSCPFIYKAEDNPRLSFQERKALGLDLVNSKEAVPLSIPGECKKTLCIEHDTITNIEVEHSFHGHPSLTINAYATKEIMEQLEDLMMCR